MRFLGVGKERIARTKKRYRGLDERKINQSDLAHEWLMGDGFSLNLLVIWNYVLTVQVEGMISLC